MLQDPAAYPDSDEPFATPDRPFPPGTLRSMHPCPWNRDRLRDPAAYPVAYTSRGSQPGHDVNIALSRRSRLKIPSAEGVASCSPFSGGEVPQLPEFR